MDLSWLYSEKRILLGISGGIAAYKSAALARLFVKAGAEVTCMMTPSATRFIGPLTMEALTGRPVLREVLEPGRGSRIEHVASGEEADLMVVAPATAHTIARLANGMADEMVSTVALVRRCPLLIAPGMNVNMWSHPATQDNVKKLEERGCFRVGPEPGELACGVTGLGRMTEPNHIFEACAGALCADDLQGRKVVVTAGATREPLDPVRFLSNRSTGKMGCAVARAALARGAEVVLVAGPTVTDDLPWGVEIVRVETGLEMREVVMSLTGEADAVVKAAAVSDWRSAEVSAEKWRKETMGDEVALRLVRNPDILKELGTGRGDRSRPVLVGFAAEHGGDCEEKGRAKLEAKRCDVIVINDVSAEGCGFGTDTNRGVVLDRQGGRKEIDLMSKDEMGHAICDRISALLEG
jgi:phosphopantothenoylcysteine decarboxylase/phosphopantothenate--cysteine ligase